jgi:hypothetical protein
VPPKPRMRQRWGDVLYAMPMAIGEGMIVYTLFKPPTSPGSSPRSMVVVPARDLA